MEKKLYRSRNKKVIAGLAGGFGEYLDIDPIIIRIIIVLITVFHGVGLIIYIIMWIVIPEEPYTNAFYGINSDAENDIGKTVNEAANNFANEIKAKSSSSNGRIVVGVILILIGIVFLFERFFPFFDFEFVFSVGLVLLGIAMIFNFFNKSEKSQ